MSAVATRRPAVPRAAAFDLSRLLFAVVGVILAAMIVLPVGWLLVASVTGDHEFTLANYAQLLTDPTMLKPLWNTLLSSTFVALACVVVGVPMGWCVARTDMPLRRLVRALTMASLVTPPFLGAIAWELLAAPNSGFLNQGARALFGLDRSVHPFNIYSLAGLTFVNFLYTFPYVFVLVANALERIPSDLEDASAILGGTGLQTAWRVTLPLILPSILAGALVAFLQSTTVFGSAAIITLPAGFHTMTTRIWSLFQFPPHPGLAAAASMPMLLLTLALLRAQRAVLGRRSYALVGGKGARRTIARLGAWKWLALAFCTCVLLCALVLPYGALLDAAFVKFAPQLPTAQNFTLSHLHFVFFELDAAPLALRNTFVLALGAATIGTALATVTAYITARRAVPGWQSLAFLANAPLAIPGIVLGVGLFLAYTRPPFVLFGTLWIMLIAFVTIEFPAAFQQLSAVAGSVHPELEEAGRILGATRLRTLRDIAAPLMRSGMVATWCFIFIGAIREISAAILLFTAPTRTVSVVIYDLNESGDTGSIAVLGLLLMVVTFGVVLIANRIPVAATAATEIRE
ncbi:MAG TPA: iron ABC transporter permease [Candidatus Acidoferrum sp.]|nr:iron ABC transporter permease [Candidatus Acidoferrum sp.]